MGKDKVAPGGKYTIKRPAKRMKLKSSKKDKVAVKKQKIKHKWGSRQKKHIKEECRKEEIECFEDELGLPRASDRVMFKSKNTSATPKETLRERMMKRLEAARFRQINEVLDSTTKVSDPFEAFQSDPELFKKYHETYRERVEQWPKNPLNTIIKWVKKKLGKDSVIVDFGCGEAKLSASVPNKVHSFDLFALNERVTACDMSDVPLEDGSVDAAVFCLSLMGTDVSKFIGEANRVLKINGLLKIAEASSRFSGNIYATFLKRIKKFGFVVKQGGQGQSRNGTNANPDNVFLMFEFKKIKSVKSVLGRLPAIKLAPSVYKKR